MKFSLFVIGYIVGLGVGLCIGSIIARLDINITPVVTKIEQRGYYVGDDRWIQAPKGMFNVGDTIYFTSVKPE